MWKKLSSSACSLIALLWLPMYATAQAKPHDAPPKPPTLASLLPGLAPPPQGMLLIIGADTADLPKDAPVPPNPITVDALAQAFGYQAQPFGIITAFAPATRLTLNPAPAAPDVSADMAPYQAIKLLVATLDDTQWHALTSDTGLGFADLTDDTQRGLFHALFRDNQLYIATNDTQMNELPEDKRTDIQNLTDKIDGVHLRMGQTASIYIHDTAGKTLFFGEDNGGDKPVFRLYRPKHAPPPATHNVVLRATVPNTLRPGDLVLPPAVAQAPVMLADLHTVGELVTRIGVATHTELYADPRYAARTITLLGPAIPTAPATDLLRALCLCAAATVRCVGPAYVLTDDTLGLGVRRQILVDWDKKADAQQTDLTDAAGRAMLAKHGDEARFVPSFGNAMALTPAQIKAEKLSDGVPQVPGYDGNTVAFSALTPVQQGVAKRIADDYNARRAASSLPDYMADDKPAAASPTPEVSLNPRVQIQLLIPTVTDPVEMSGGSQPMMFFYWPGDDAMYANYFRAAKEKPKPPAKPVPPLGPLLHTGALRALVAHTRTLADLDAVLPVMQRLGLNTLFLDVFSGGVARVHGTPLSAANSPDLLTEAIKRAKPLGIAVYADMNLLTWGQSPPAALTDPNILGENTTQSAVRRHVYQRSPDIDNDGNPIPFAPPDVDVNPAAARDTLLSVVHAIAAVPGLAGMVWDGSVPDSDVGYTFAARLAFLRAHHADPLDIDSTPRYELPRDIDLPQFDDDTADSALRGQWDTFRKDANTQVLLALRRAAAHPVLPILMEQDGGNKLWYATWDNPRAIPPSLRDLFPGKDFPSQAEVAAAARAQGHLVLRIVNLKDAAHPDDFARALAPDPPAARWDGFVLDIEDDSATRGPHPLEALVQAAPPPRPH